jgi:NAD(P)H-binding
LDEAAVLFIYEDSLMKSMAKNLVILYGQGGLSDVGRHAVEVALAEWRAEDCRRVTILTQYPELLKEKNWNSPGDHNVMDLVRWKEDAKLISVTNGWNDPELVQHFESCDAVISCLGNRQPRSMGAKASSWCAAEGNALVIKAMKEHGVKRVVVCSSMGVEEDWPPLEFHWAGRIMACLFVTPGMARRPFQDLTEMEKMYKQEPDLDYLFVRPYGLSEDVVPKNKWKLQAEKYKDKDIDFVVAKMDVARYMMQEALTPTRHRVGVVIGGVKE